ncbi:hypothetical protein CONPUDRAFT_94334 [Coniophora puteana RWD-64-598 SS2]|uniref:G domain-containing protein n=1 Tax=Coniophora puteana (strain RWD-64-598) TaxID=741705 RepID=A0A5M3N448_CONPW|nr:uncharacterized protein CONPUDRAFT_94334 [Coniophora puteana RWD-64-598 SS2]EIW86066.1 hypothetical protein CONPUDRAFT_94334 [Coniophora puteana RWD-64-598 SS2]
MSQPLNIILFGETGAGKSSIVNMLTGHPIAEISNEAQGCTFKFDWYPVDIGGETYRIFNTAGLDEGVEGTMPPEDAIVQLYQLMTNLEGGISLIIFVMRGPRIKDASQRNWRLFYEIFCKQQVNAAIVITGLEQEDDMDDWWPRNKAHFYSYGMRPFGAAGITATLGKRKGNRYLFQEEYDESVAKVRKLIRDNAMPNPRCIDKVEWFADVMLLWCIPVGQKSTAEVQRLIDRCGMSQDKAGRLARRLSYV